MSNKGSAGIDGLPVDELSGYLDIPREALLFAIDGTSDKDETTRKEKLAAFEKQFEIGFKAGSHGFRINRNAHQAVMAAQRHINDGYTHIVDIDLKTFFDEVDHCILLQLLYRKIKCPLTMRLIRKWPRAPIMFNGKLAKRRKAERGSAGMGELLPNGKCSRQTQRPRRLGP